MCHQPLSKSFSTILSVIGFIPNGSNQVVQLLCCGTHKSRGHPHTVFTSLPPLIRDSSHQVEKSATLPSFASLQPWPPSTMVSSWHVVTWCWSARRFQTSGQHSQTLSLFLFSWCMYSSSDQDQILDLSRPQQRKRSCLSWINCYFLFCNFSIQYAN